MTTNGGCFDGGGGGCFDIRKDKEYLIIAVITCLDDATVLSIDRPLLSSMTSFKYAIFSGT